MVLCMRQPFHCCDDVRVPAGCNERFYQVDIYSLRSISWAAPGQLKGVPTILFALGVYAHSDLEIYCAY
jgi:hypothetical protein